MRIAITREVSESIARCELTHVPRGPIDVGRARAQHAAYEALLAALGCEVVRLRPEPELPDGVFVEDTAIVLDELAIVARPGAASRRSETCTMAQALAPYRTLVQLQPPATLDGGDVLAIGRTLFVGRSARTNEAGRQQVAGALAPFGYQVRPVQVNGCLHLKSAATAIADGVVLLNPAWIDPGPFAALERVEVDPAEPFAANALRVGDALVQAERHPRTRGRIERRGIAVATVDLSELAKAEGGVTCCSVVFDV